MKSQRRYAITTGDEDGIGLEVTYKALLSAKLPRGVQIFVFQSSRTPKFLERLQKKIEKKFKTAHIACGVFRGTEIFKSSAQIVFLKCSSAPTQWVLDAAGLCLSGQFAALITGPLSKVSIHEFGLKQVGHTEILKTLSNSKNLNMAFLGKHFHVVLASGHIALSDVSKKLTVDVLKVAIARANALRGVLPTRQRTKPLALVGLNPHAGELGLIGNEEQDVFRKAFRWAHSRKITMIGPLVPDAAFLRKNWSQYSVFICPYHDQGLIPFKMIHGAESGVHITLGLPFVRTSVDHGTAKDLFGLNKANPNSMADAIKWAIKFSSSEAFYE